MTHTQTEREVMEVKRPICINKENRTVVNIYAPNVGFSGFINNSGYKWTDGSRYNNSR